MASVSPLPSRCVDRSAPTAGGLCGSSALAHLFHGRVLVEALAGGDAELAMIDVVLLEVRGDPLRSLIAQCRDVEDRVEADPIDHLERPFRCAGEDAPDLVDRRGIGDI